MADRSQLAMRLKRRTMMGRIAAVAAGAALAPKVADAKTKPVSQLSVRSFIDMQSECAERGCSLWQSDATILHQGAIFQNGSHVESPRGEHGVLELPRLDDHGLRAVAIWRMWLHSRTDIPHYDCRACGMVYMNYATRDRHEFWMHQMTEEGRRGLYGGDDPNTHAPYDGEGCPRNDRRSPLRDLKPGAASAYRLEIRDLGVGGRHQQGIEYAGGFFGFEEGAAEWERLHGSEGRNA